MGDSMEIRKLQKVGDRSFSVSLPKGWVVKNNLNSKDSLYIEEDENNNLVVSTKGENLERSERLVMNIDKITNISEFVIFCYVKNVEKVKLFWKKTDLKKIREIKRVIRYLDGYDITNEDENSIEIEFLFKDVNITVKSIMRRILHLINLMVSSLEEKDVQSLTDAEASVDRLYHLSKRVLFSCIKSYKLRKENEFSNDEDIFFYRNIVKKLEGIGDMLFKMKEISFTDADMAKLKKIISYLESIMTASELSDSFIRCDTKSKNHDVENGFLRIVDLTEDIFIDLNSIFFNRKYF